MAAVSEREGGRAQEPHRPGLHGPPHRPPHRRHATPCQLRVAGGRRRAEGAPELIIDDLAGRPRGSSRLERAKRVVYRGIKSAMLNPLNSLGTLAGYGMYQAARLGSVYSRLLFGPLEKRLLSRRARAPADRAVTVERVNARELDADIFLDRYLKAGRPVVVHGGCASWPAVADALWTPEKLAARFGDFIVPIQGSYFDTKAWMLFRDFCRQLAAQGSGGIRYFRFHSLSWREVILVNVGWFSASRSNLTIAMFRGLRGEWQVPAFLPRRGHTFTWTIFGDEDFTERMPYDFGVYVSGRGAHTTLHADGSRTHAMIAQVHGTKTAYLLPPEAQRELERLPPVGVDYVSLADHHSSGAAFEYSTARCELEPGDVLFLPRNWLHEVHTTSDESVSLTFNFTIGWMDYFKTIGQMLAFGKSGAHRLPRVRRCNVDEAIGTTARGNE